MTRKLSGIEVDEKVEAIERCSEELLYFTSVVVSM